MTVDRLEELDGEEKWVGGRWDREEWLSNKNGTGLEEDMPPVPYRVDI